MKTYYKLFTFLFITFLTLTFSSCDMGIVGNGNVEERTEDVNKFTRLDISGNFDVFLLEGKRPGLRIEADENLQDIIMVRQSGSLLIIETRENIIRAKKKSLYITYTDLERMELNGAIDLRSESTIDVRSLSIFCSGASDMSLDIRANKLLIDVSGATDCDLEGRVDRAELELSGAGDFNAIDLETKELTLEMSGAGHARVYATEELNVNVSGAGSVRYKGNPDIRKSISGIGSLKRY